MLTSALWNFHKLPESEAWVETSGLPDLGSLRSPYQKFAKFTERNLGNSEFREPSMSSDKLSRWLNRVKSDEPAAEEPSHQAIAEQNQSQRPQQVKNNTMSRARPPSMFISSEIPHETMYHVCLTQYYNRAANFWTHSRHFFSVFLSVA